MQTRSVTQGGSGGRPGAAMPAAEPATAGASAVGASAVGASAIGASAIGASSAAAVPVAASPATAATRISATPAALALTARLVAQHGPVMFHQSGGCCDGSAPMCYPAGEFMVGDADVKLGEIGGMPFYMSRAQFAYWEHTHLIIDAVPGNGGMFSLERPTGLRFLTRSRLYSDEEWASLPPV